MATKHQQFESLVKSYYQQLFRYAFWLSKSQSVAEDLVQEAYARAWKSLHQLKDFRSAKPWLFTILNRENARRFEKKHLPTSSLSDEWQLEQIADPHDDIQTLMTRRAIMQLPEQYRHPLTLQIIGGLSTNEIADVMQVSINVVTTRLYRARGALKKLLEADVNTGGASNG